MTLTAGPVGGVAHARHTPGIWPGRRTPLAAGRGGHVLSGRCRRYREFMMSAVAGFHDAQPVSASSPREIRAALEGEEAGHFDREYRQAMADAAESLDLSDVLAMLGRWRRVAWSTRDDPDAHRRMLDNADRLIAGENIATAPWQQVKTRLGL